MCQSFKFYRTMKNFSICVQNLLSSKTVRSFENIRKEINVMMDKLEKASSSSSRVNLSKLLMTLTNDVIARIVLGKKYSSDEREDYSNNLVRRYMEILGASPIGEYIPSLAWVTKVTRKVDKLKNEIDSFLEKVVQEHVDADEDQDKTTPFELDRTTSTFTLLEWTMTELMRHPKCMKKLQDEIRSVQPHNSYVSEKEAEKMNYLYVVIKEALRLPPPVQINVWAIQRQIATWGPDADEFRPERHLDSLLDFHGNDQKEKEMSWNRACISLGRGYMANLVNRFDWRIEVGPLGDDKHDLDEASSIDVCRKFPLFALPSLP
ncbi:hypothetical protein HID58_029551 [Brassica napus]|uniref:Uncharacterized protein n=1 Tax=Brassica napus TaxID=3708 RepID=A0ABQ8CDI7_BRANA|nr:hypothetical protein HID58_029551 [Brassica napus]